MKRIGDMTEAIAQFGGKREDWRNPSTGINPRAWPIPCDLPDAIWQQPPTRMDDEDARLEAARRAYRVPQNVATVAVSGTQALIQLLSLLAADDPVTIEVIAVKALDDISERARHVVLVNPVKLDGHIVDHTAMIRATAIAARRGGCFIIDEAFADVDVTIGVARLHAQHPIVILHSFGKRSAYAFRIPRKN